MDSQTRGTTEFITMHAIRFTGLLVLINFFLLSGCQEEKIEIKEPPADKAIAPDSPLVDYVSRVTLKDGSSDNILDSSSCTSFLLPITVIVNGQPLTIHSEDDFDEIEDIFDDDNVLHIVFPVTVVLADHSELAVNDEDELEDLIESCIDDEDDIECIDFQYPFDLFVYDSDNQISNVVTITNDASLHVFVEGLDDEDIVSVDFPITMTLYNGQEIIVNSNDELEDAIEEALDACNEEDEDNQDRDELIDILIDGKWAITYFFDETLKTSLFDLFELTFNADGSIAASNGIISIGGTWESEVEDGKLLLELDFESDPPFDEIGEEWMVIEKSNAQITLEEAEAEEDDAAELVIEKK